MIILRLRHRTDHRIRGRTWEEQSPFRVPSHTCHTYTEERLQASLLRIQNRIFLCLCFRRSKSSLPVRAEVCRIQNRIFRWRLHPGVFTPEAAGVLAGIWVSVPVCGAAFPYRGLYAGLLSAG